MVRSTSTHRWKLAASSATAALVLVAGCSSPGRTLTRVERSQGDGQRLPDAAEFRDEARRLLNDFFSSVQADAAIKPDLAMDPDSQEFFLDREAALDRMDEFVDELDRLGARKAHGDVAVTRREIADVVPLQRRWLAGQREQLALLQHCFGLSRSLQVRSDCIDEGTRKNLDRWTALAEELNRYFEEAKARE